MCTSTHTHRAVSAVECRRGTDMTPSLAALAASAASTTAAAAATGKQCVLAVAGQLAVTNGRVGVSLTILAAFETID